MTHGGFSVRFVPFDVVLNVGEVHSRRPRVLEMSGRLGRKSCTGVRRDD